MKKSAFLSSAAIAAIAVSAQGAGFSLFQGDATGIADAAGSIAKGGRIGDMYYNPAQFSSATGTAVQAGCFFTRPHLKIETTNPYTGEKTKTPGEKKWFSIPHVYFATPLCDDVTLGFGVFSRMGLGDEFPRDWPGRYNSTKVEFATVDLSPAVSWRLADWIAVGGGLTMQHFDITLEQDIDAAGIAGLRRYNDPSTVGPRLDVHQRIHGIDECAVGWDLGVKLTPVEKLYVGLAYHSSVSVDAKGHASYAVPAAVRVAYPSFFRYTTAEGKIKEPDYWMGAVAYDFTDRLTLGVNVTRSGWSSWDRLVIREGDAFLPGHSVIVSEKDWNDVWRFSVGGSYRLDDNWTALASFTWDDSPINRAHSDYIVPADTREIYAVGLAWESGRWTVDATYFFEKINDMSVEARPSEGIMKGRYCDGFSHAVAFSVGYAF